MKAVSFKAYKGRNFYSHKRCIRVDLQSCDNINGSDYNVFAENLIILLPELIEHRCSASDTGGFYNKLKNRTSFHHILGHIAIALQNKAGVNVSFCTDNETSFNNCYTVYEYEYEDTGMEAGKVAVDIINSLCENKNYELNKSILRLKEILAAEQLPSAIQKILKEADKKDIPILELKKNKLFQLGYGKHSTIVSENGDGYTFFTDYPKTIPVAAITGTNGKTTTTRLIGYALTKAGYNVGMTTTSGIYINDKCIFEGDTTGPQSALSVLTNKEIDAAVLETARGGIVRDGLAYDLADVAVITNIGDDHIGLDGINSIEDLAKVKILVGEAVKDNGYVVVNGDDTVSRSVFNRIKSKLIVFSKNKTNDLIAAAIRKGSFGIYIDEGYLCVERENWFLPLIKVDEIGITLKGALSYNIENAMAACGALIGFGIDYSVIRDSLMSFQCNEELNPGRFNVFDIGGITAILDYGHNLDGYRCVLEGIRKMNPNKLIGVIGVPGDRMSESIVAVGAMAGNYLDYILIKEDKDRRGRALGEVAELLKNGVLNSGFDLRNIEIILSEEAALERALDFAEAGDIVIAFFEDYAPLLRIIKRRIHELNMNSTVGKKVAEESVLQLI